MSNSDLRKNIASLFILQGSNFILPLITLPYLARILGTENFGRIIFTQAVINYFVILTDYGFNLSATRSVSLLKNQPEKLYRLFSTITLIKIGIMLSCLGLMLLGFSVSSRFEADKNLYLLAYLAVTGNTFFPVWFFQGIGYMEVMTVISIVSRSVMVIATFLYVDDQDDYLIATGLQSGSFLLAGGISWGVLSNKGLIQLRIPNFSEIKHEIKSGWHIFISSIAINLYTTTTTVILGFMAGPIAVAYFSSAEKIIKAIQGLLTPVSQACYPHIARLAQSSSKQAFQFISNLLLVQSTVTFCMTLFVFYFAGELTTTILGQGFSESARLLQWMALLPWVVGLSNIFGVQTMLNFGMNAIFSRILLFSGIVHLILLTFLVYLLAEEGAAISILATEIVVTTLMGISLYRKGLLQHILQKEKLSTWTTKRIF